MKKPSAGSPYTKFIAAASAFVWTIAIATSARGAQLKEARVTQVVNDVKLLLQQAAPRPAAISDLVRQGTAVRTGTQSRSELTFADLTITRLGANTIFSFNEGTREMTLTDGAILFQVPKGSGGATIRTAGITAAITGTTGIGEFHPATTSHPQPFSKWLCLEGTFSLYLPNGQSVELGPGRMVTTDGKSFSKVLTFNIAKLVSNSLFFTGFDTPLASMNLIMLESQNQLASALLATTTTNPLDPTRIVNVINQASVAEETPTPSTTPPVTPTPSITPPPTATPTKFGTPAVIASPNPYLITSGTTITTDPSITTNGVTDFGKIYRAQTDDGTFSLWAFGSTSAFDTALRIDDVFFADPTHFPIAVFKFQSLSLTGDPTIDTTNGVTKLALIGLDGITSGPPGGTLTFTGLDLLALATVNGSINLTSDVSFQNLDELAMYGRGAGSNLILNSSISNIGILELAAEGSIYLTNAGAMSVGGFDATAGNNLTLQIGGSLLLNGRVRLDTLVLPGTTLASGADLILNVVGDFTNNSATEFSRLRVTNEGAHVGTGGNIAVNIGGDLTTTGTGGDFELAVQNTNGQIDNGGNMALTVGGSIDAAGALSATLDNTGGVIGTDTIIILNSSGAITVHGDATFQILNSDNGIGGSPGQIGGNAIIGVSSGGDFSANSLNAIINDRHAGSIGSSAALAFDVGGALSIANDASLEISTSNDGTGGGTIGSDATVGLSAGSISVGGAFTTFVSNNGGGSILGNTTLFLSSLGDSTTGGEADFIVDNSAFGSAGFFTGGENTGSVTIQLVAQSVSTGGGLFTFVFNDGGGHIGADALITAGISGNLTTGSDLFFDVENSADTNDSGTLPGGAIDGNATVTVTAGNIVSGGVGEFAVLNNDSRFLSLGGTISGDATVSLTAASISTTGFFQPLVNNTNGIIGGGASVTVGVTGDINVGAETFFNLLNTNGAITNDATSTVTAVNFSTGSTFEFQILNDSGSIGGNATLSANLFGSLTSAGDAFVQIINSGGAIGGIAEIDVNAASITANSLVTQIDNTGGSIGASTEGGATINMNVSGSANVTNNATFQILGSDGAVGGAAITFNGGSYDASGTFLTFIDQDGTITFNNANAHADVLKVGALGTNGVLNIGGGMLSADTTLELYASGSNGRLNFTSNVTLGGNSAKILAANSVTIFDNVVVTIDSKPADVYTGFTGETPNANYTGFGGNGSTTGKFAGLGAHNPQPLSNAPQFTPVSRATVRTGGNGTGGRKIDRVIHVSSSDELLSLLDRAAPGPGGKITVRTSKPTNHSKDANRIGAANRLNAASRRNADRRPVDVRTASSSLPRRLMQ